MTQTPRTSPYDDRVQPHPYSLIVPEEEHLYYMGATHPHLLLPTTSRLDVTHTYNYSQLSVPPSAPYQGELNPPRPTNLSYPPVPAGSQPLNDTLTDCGNLGLLQPSEIYNPWGIFYPPPNVLPNATYGISPPTLHHPTLHPTLYSEFPCRQSPNPWPTANIQVSPVDEYLPTSNFHPLASPLHNATPSPDPHLDHTLEPYDGTLDVSASYPCLWTEGGVICNVMVQATRSHMNRHLHTYHGFGGSDTRQTRCYWTGCGETMQQGSIARHMVTCHLQAKVTCPMCSKKLSRQDVISKHQRVCPAASAWR